MGRLYRFDCERCGYQVNASGQPDRGGDCFTTTMACATCRELYDLVTHLRLPKGLTLRQTGRLPRSPHPDLSKIVLPGHVHSSHILARPGGRMFGRLLDGHHTGRWVELRLQCPVNSLHRMKEWKHPGPCPRCGIYLDRTLMPFLIWE